MTSGLRSRAAVRTAWDEAQPVAPADAERRHADGHAAQAGAVRFATVCGGRSRRGLTLPLGRVFPRDATLTAVAVGDTAWVTFPGELQTALGREIKAAGQGALPRTRPWPA